MDLFGGGRADGHSRGGGRPPHALAQSGRGRDDQHLRVAAAEGEIQAVAKVGLGFGGSSSSQEGTV